MRFIDFLSMHQDHPSGDLPVVGTKLIGITDLETGEREREAPNSKKLEGSFSTSLLIRCDGTRVTVEGNPSRWGRPDNLWGYQTLDQCVQVYNRELLNLNLPPFTKCKKLGHRQGKDGEGSKRIVDGAVFTRIDFTENKTVGKGNERAVIKALSTNTVGRGKTGFLYPDGNTTDWGKGSTYWYLKIYNKHKELLKHLSKTKQRNMTKEHKVYLQKVIEYCENAGIIRIEKEFKRSFLAKKGLDCYGLTIESDFDEYLADFEKMIERNEMNNFSYETIADQLLDNEIVKSRASANSTQLYAMAWLHGTDIKTSLKKSQYYEHRRRLISLGIDISIPYDASRHQPLIMRQREITVSTAIPPDWYQMPEVQILRLVA